MEQINTYNYWDAQCHTKNISQINKTFTDKWIINRVIKPFKVQKQSRPRLYNTLAIPTLLYGSHSNLENTGCLTKQ